MIYAVIVGVVVATEITTSSVLRIAFVLVIGSIGSFDTVYSIDLISVRSDFNV